MKKLLAALRLLILGVLFGLAAAPAAAGTIYIKDGHVWKGRIIGLSKESVILERADGSRIAIDRKYIEKVALDDDDPIAAGADRRPKPEPRTYVRRDPAGESYLTQLVELSRIAEQPQPRTEAELAAAVEAPKPPATRAQQEVRERRMLAEMKEAEARRQEMVDREAREKEQARARARDEAARAAARAEQAAQAAVRARRERWLAAAGARLAARAGEVAAAAAGRSERAARRGERVRERWIERGLEAEMRLDEALVVLGERVELARAEAREFGERVAARIAAREAEQRVAAERAARAAEALAALEVQAEREFAATAARAEAERTAREEAERAAAAKAEADRLARDEATRAAAAALDRADLEAIREGWSRARAEALARRADEEADAAIADARTDYRRAMTRTKKTIDAIDVAMGLDEKKEEVARPGRRGLLVRGGEEASRGGKRAARRIAEPVVVTLPGLTLVALPAAEISAFTVAEPIAEALRAEGRFDRTELRLGSGPAGPVPEVIAVAARAGGLHIRRHAFIEAGALVFVLSTR